MLPKQARLLMSNNHKHDAFIAHASEDKEAFVQALAVALKGMGLSIWYDEFSLDVGSSLSRSIDKGLANSRYGIIVISEAFIRKNWPEYELRGLITLEIDQGRDVILPIWFNVTKEEVMKFSPSLADKVALDVSLGAADIAIRLLRRLRPDLYAEHPRSHWIDLVNGPDFQELHEKIGELEEQLSQFQCPHCGSPQETSVNAPLDPEERDWDMLESFACGFTTHGVMVERPCPSDPRFPTLQDFDLEFKQHSDDLWRCIASPKTMMAQALGLLSELAPTKEEAKQRLLDRYERLAKKWDGDVT